MCKTHLLFNYVYSFLAILKKNKLYLILDFSILLHPSKFYQNDEEFLSYQNKSKLALTEDLNAFNLSLLKQVSHKMRFVSCLLGSLLALAVYVPTLVKSETGGS